MKTLEFTNKKNEIVTIEYRDLFEEEITYNGVSKCFINKIKVNGICVASSMYSPAKNEKELKSTGNRYRNSRRYKLTA